MVKKTCCNCPGGKGWYHGQETGFGCHCDCHNNGGKYPKAKMESYLKKNPENNPKVKNFPSWFQKDKQAKIATKKENAKDE